MRCVSQLCGITNNYIEGAGPEYEENGTEQGNYIQENYI